jgi:hypothetical protein
MPSGLFRTVFVLLIGFVLGATMVEVMYTQTDLTVSLCFLFSIQRWTWQR